MPKVINHTTAIDLVGAVIFGADWIRSISASDVDLLKTYGPTPARPETIKPCPPDKAAALDRAMGRDRRFAAQRQTALAWIEAHRLYRSYGCDSEALTAALADEPALNASHRGKLRGRHRTKAAGVEIKMQADVESGSQTVASLGEMIGKTLKAKYGADPKTCRAALASLRLRLG